LPNKAGVTSAGLFFSGTHQSTAVKQLKPFSYCATSPQNSKHRHCLASDGIPLPTDERGATPVLKTLTLAIAIAAVAAAAPAHAFVPISTNGTSFNGLDANAMTQNAIDAGATLSGRVIGIELLPATGDIN